MPQASNIDLSWDHESAKTCEGLLRTAYDGFRILTVEDSKFLKSFPLAKRAELLEEVDFSKLDCYVHPDVKTSVHATRSRHQSLFEWLSVKLKVCCCEWKGYHFADREIHFRPLSSKNLALSKACPCHTSIITISEVIELPFISSSRRRRVKQWLDRRCIPVSRFVQVSYNRPPLS